MLIQTSLLKLKDIFMLNVLKMYYKYQEKSLPSYAANMFSVATCASNYNSCVTKSLTNVNNKTTGADKCIRSDLPNVINETDTVELEERNSNARKALKIMKNIDRFVSNVSQCILQQVNVLII